MTIKNAKFNIGGDPSGGSASPAAAAAAAVAAAEMKQSTESVVDQFAYPILTEEISFPSPAPASTGGGSGGAGSGSLARTVDAALRDVLGGRSKPNDPKGFTARLVQSFNLNYVDGHVEATWVPPTSVQVQADLGAITGAQASIYARAKAALDDSLPLLERLSSLRTDILPEDQEATRSIFRTELTQLVNELGIEGGPRVQRVDELFGYLLGVSYTPASTAAPTAPPPVPNSDELVRNQQALDDHHFSAQKLSASNGWPSGWPKNHLGELGLRFGMQRRRVNTIEDEQDLTNFIILLDYVTGLWYTWITQRRFFSRVLTPHTQPFFGTQMVLLSRALAVVGESVQEVNFTMDSVFLGPAERQTLQLNFPSTLPIYLQYVPNVPSAIEYPNPPPNTQPTTPPIGTPFAYVFPENTSPLYVAELLDWIDKVATEEGPRLIQDAGKDGVVALSQTLDNLRTFARGALLYQTPAAGAPASWGGVQQPYSVPKGYATSRVQRAVRELADSIYTALQLAAQIKGLNIPNE